MGNSKSTDKHLARAQAAEKENIKLRKQVKEQAARISGLKDQEAALQMILQEKEDKILEKETKLQEIFRLHEEMAQHRKMLAPDLPESEKKE